MERSKDWPHRLRILFDVTFCVFFSIRHVQGVTIQRSLGDLLDMSIPMFGSKVQNVAAAVRFGEKLRFCVILCCVEDLNK